MWRRGIALAVVVMLAVPGMAFAKSKKKKDDDGIWDTGIKSMDVVFKDVANIDRRLDSARAMLGSARGDLNTALGLNSKTTLPKAMAELNKRAGGKLKIATTGNVPKLSASDAVPSDVQKGIDAVNGFSGDLARSIADLSSASQSAVALTRKTKDFPKNVKAELAKEDIISQVIGAPKAVKAVSHNLTVTKALPGKADKVVGRMNNIQSAMISEFTPSTKKPAGK
jgi:hypothetical protein